MPNELQVVHELPPDITKLAWTEDQKNLIKNTVAKGQDLTDDEFLLFAYRCKVMGLNPLLGHVIPVKFKDQQSGQKHLSFITSIDALRTIAENSKELAGISDYFFDDDLTQYQLLMKHKGEQDRKKIIPKTATCTVNRIKQGIICPSTATARWSDYLPKWQNRQAMWWKFPFLMLGKCAEALAIRKAFPVNTMNLYIPEEMEQASADVEPMGVADENVDIVNDIYGLYSKLHLSAGEQIDLNMKYAERNEIIYAPHENLVKLKKYLEGRIKREQKKPGDNGKKAQSPES